MKYVLVTGASGDIGEATVLNLAKKGYSIYCHYYKNEKKISKLIAMLCQTYPKQDFWALQADLTKQYDIEQLMHSIFQLDAIVFAHGDTVYELLSETTSSDMTHLWKSHVESIMMICQMAQVKLTQQKGSIVVVSSIYGIHGSPMEVVYSSVKGAQNAFVVAYSKECASLGITINAVAPGAVNTQMNSDWTKEEIKSLIQKIPMKRMANSDEIASMIVYLLSNEARYITGSIIPITGGWTP